MNALSGIGVYLCHTLVGVPHDKFLFTALSAERLMLAGIAQIDVSVALESRPRVRRHIGSSLQAFGRDRDGEWLAVALVEENDDEYVVTGARYLEPDEVAAIERYIGED